MTQAYLRLRACERFGLDWRAVDREPPHVAALLLAYERIRQAEEAAELTALVAASVARTAAC